MAIARCERALAQASATADRLALLRSIIRLKGGRIDLTDLARPLAADDFGQLVRFRIARTNSDLSLRLIDEDDAAGLEGLGAALRFDPTSRHAYEPASPDAVLLRLTDHRRYRTVAQKAAVRALLTQPPGSGLMVSMPTGSGKSLLFQIAANFGRESEPGACAIVITPTVALALDHQRTLAAMPGLEASKALIGDTPPAESEAIVNAFRRGEIPILLLSPEKALGAALSEYLVEAASPHSVEYGLDARLTHVFVDEAHIVEAWGRSFRPDFQRLPALLARLRAANPAVRAVLLSATLPVNSRSVLREGWKLDGEWLEVDARLPRYEHDVVIGRFTWETQRQAALDHIIDRAPRPLILYTTKIADASNLFHHLVSERGYHRAALFTGDTSSYDRRRIVEGWADDAFDIVVATSAFGMGINKADVRSVIHACLPEGAARWYQEIGRASRDGGQGLAACLFVEGPADSDVDQAYGLATSGWLTRDLAEQRWEGMLKTASDKKYVGEYLQMTIDLDAFREGLRPKAGDWNRGWNMTLLTLMQRAGILRITTIPGDGDQPEFSWTVEVLDHRAQNGVDDEVWELISRFRDKELSGARHDMDAFVTSMRNPDKQCVTRHAFEIIEPRSFAPPCGRCPACRKAGTRPPATLAACGLEARWQTAHPGRRDLPGDTLLVAPADPYLEAGFGNLIRTLAAFGIDQFVVPHEQAFCAAELLIGSDTRLGLVLDDREWTGSNRPSDMPTAIILSDDPARAEALIDRIDDLRSANTSALLVVGRPERLIRGRRLDQTVSRYAPYAEGQLLSLAGPGVNE